MDNLKSGTIHFNDSVEAAAYAVCLEGMNEGVKFHIDSGPSGYDLVLETPIPMVNHLGIMGAINLDQKSNPEKWNKTRTEVKEEAKKNYEKN